MSNTNFTPKAEWKVSGDKTVHTNYRAASNELVIAWALDKVTREPRYILELSEQERGAKCNCICASCDLPLTAVNAAKSEYPQRPHFRHTPGAERSFCFILSAR